MSEELKEARKSSIFTKEQILTIPNMLSFLRLALIPVILWLYLTGELVLAAVVIVLSSITDIVDGFIARRFNMVSDFGKAIDPIADKLTQIAVLFCLVTRFPLMLIPLIIMIIKELTSFILRLVLFKKTDIVVGAVWHGKLNTVVLHSVILLHVLWIYIPEAVSAGCIAASVAIMLTSFVLYTIDGAKLLINNLPKKQ
ncbi:MAG: CDP-alcohol phosphatidyltransferase family protein [Clostridia bacterium]|nr:CDP-alcohol phosphatidyltransferase family protein [Clostridia bacterium]